MLVASQMIPPFITGSVSWCERAIEERVFGRLFRGERLLLVFIPVVCALCAYIATSQTRTSASVAAIWPANGVLLAGLLLAGHRMMRVKVLLACFAGNVAANILVGLPAPAGAGFAFLNGIEGLIAYLLLARLDARNLDQGGQRTLLRFIVACAFASIASSIGGAAIAHVSFGANFTSAFVTWFMADTLGLLVITPAFVLAFAPSSAARPPPMSRIVGLGALLVFVCAIVFAQDVAPLTFLIIPVSVIIAFQLGPRYAAFSTLFLTLVSVSATYSGHGPGNLTQVQTEGFAVWLVQMLCIVNHFTTLFVAASIAERDALQDRIGRLSNANERSLAQLDTALDVMDQGICLYDAEFRVMMFNDRFLQLYRLPRGDVHAGLHFKDLTRLCSAAGTDAVRRNASTHATDADIEQVLADGRTIRISQRRTPDKGLVCTYTDVTDARRAEDELRYQTQHDLLTGLCNRAVFNETVEAHCRGGKACAVLYIDVDYFKAINDRYGHAAGDTVLQVVAKRLEGCVRGSDLVARLGGDEFAAVLTDLRDEHAALTIATRMLELAREPIVLENGMCVTSLSIGAAVSSGALPEEVLRLADVALYEAKGLGRNRVCIGHSDAQAVDLFQFALRTPEQTSEAA